MKERHTPGECRSACLYEIITFPPRLHVVLEERLVVLELTGASASETVPADRPTPPVSSIGRVYGSHRLWRTIELERCVHERRTENDLCEHSGARPPPNPAAQSRQRQLRVQRRIEIGDPERFRSGQPVYLSHRAYRRSDSNGHVGIDTAGMVASPRLSRKRSSE